MDTPNIQPEIIEPKKKRFPIRALVYTLGIGFALFIGFFIGKVAPDECTKSVLGAQTPDSLISHIALALNLSTIHLASSPTPTTPTLHIMVFPTATPTTAPLHLIIIPTATPTSAPLHLIIIPTATPTEVPLHLIILPTASPTPVASHLSLNLSNINLITPTPLFPINFNPLPSIPPTPVPLNSSQIQDIMTNNGITMSDPQITPNPGAQSITVKGKLEDKIFGIIPITYTADIKVNQRYGQVESISKPWWRQLFNYSITDPLTTGDCKNILSDTGCVKSGCEWHAAQKICSVECDLLHDKNWCTSMNGCRYYDLCGKCGDSDAPPEPSCSCNSTKLPTLCSAATDCEWHPECVNNGGACTDKGTDSMKACGNCTNISGQDVCNELYNYGCMFYPGCGKCGKTVFINTGDTGVPDSCTCENLNDSMTKCNGTAGCEWHSECASSYKCLPGGLDSYKACGCEGIVGQDACTKTPLCQYYATCGKCGYPNSPPNQSCSCSALKSEDLCKVGYNCEWHKECGHDGACAIQGTSSAEACK